MLWGLEKVSIKAIRLHITFLLWHLGDFLIALVCGALLISIQLFYWKYATGHWIVYSYGDQGFSWLHPHLYDYPLSFRSGWLIYTPLMFLAFFGIIPLIKNGTNRVMIIVFFLLNFYIVSSWDVWWFGGRAMIQSYAILMLPIAYMVQAMLRRRILLYTLGPVFLFFTYVNVWRECQLSTGLYDPYTNNPFYWHTLGRFHVPEQTFKYLDRNDNLFFGEPQNKKLLYQNDFEQDTGSLCSLPPIDGSRSLCLDINHKYSLIYKFPYTPGRAAWMRAQATFRRPQAEWDAGNMAQFSVKFFSHGSDFKTQMIRIDRFMHDKDKRDLFIDIKTPSQQFDSVGIQFYNGELDKTLQADNLESMVV